MQKMTELKTTHFVIKFGDIVRELENLKIRRQERHDEFLRRLSEIKERCDKLTDQKMQRLKTEGIDIGTIRAARKDMGFSYTRSTMLPASDRTKRNERIRSLETDGSQTHPHLRMELSFNCRESFKTVHFEDSGANVRTTSTDESDTNREINTYDKRQDEVHEIAKGSKIKLSRNQSSISLKIQKAKTLSDATAGETSRPVDDNHSKTIKSNPDGKNFMKKNAQHNFKRLSNKLSSVMRVINYRRYTISSTTPWELMPRHTEMYAKLQNKDKAVSQQKGGQVSQKPVLKRRERHTRIRIHSEGSLSTYSGNIDMNNRLRRVSMTIQSVKQFERKQ